MPRRALIIADHPDGSPKHLCATLDFPILRTMEESAERALPVTLEDAAQAIKEAEHIVFVFRCGSAPCPLC